MIVLKNVYLLMLNNVLFKYFFLFGVLAVFASMPSQAQTAPDFSEFQPPVASAIDKNGVNLSTGVFQLPDLDLSIGSAGSGLSRRFTDKSHTYTNVIVFEWYAKTGYGEIKEGQLGMHASYNGKVHRFVVGEGDDYFSTALDAGPYRNGSGPETLECSGDRSQFYAGGTCRLYLADGTETRYAMRGTYIDSAGYRQHHYAMATQTLRPDGEIITYYGTPGVSPGSWQEGVDKNYSVASSLGWMLKMNGRARFSDTANITAINTFHDYCSPSAVSCQVQSDAPSMRSTKSGATTVLYHNNVESLRYTESTLGEEKTYTLRYPSGLTKLVTLERQIDAGYKYRVVSVQVSNAIWRYSYNREYNGDLVATVTNPDNTTKVVTTSGAGLKSITSETGSTITYNYNYVDAGDPSSRRIRSIVKTDAPTLSFLYDSRNNVRQTTLTPKDGGTPLITTLEFPENCTNRKTCNKPVAIVRPNGLRTEYTYDPVHGGVLTETKFTEAGEVQRRFKYWEYEPRIKNSAGELVAQGKVWRLFQVFACMDTVRDLCAGSEEESMQYIYYTDNLLPLVTIDGAGDWSDYLATYYSYNYYGKLVRESPAYGGGDTYIIYDHLQRKRGEIGVDPDGEDGSKPRLATRYGYDADGRIVRVDSGYARGTDAAALNAMTVLNYSTTTYNSTTGLASQERRYYRNGAAGSGWSYELTQMSYDSMRRLQCVAQRLNPGFYATLAATATSACSLGQKGMDGNDRINYYDYHSDGKVRWVRQAYASGNQRRAYEKIYNTNGTLQYQYDGKGNRTAYSYDGFNRLRSTCYPYKSSANSTNPSDCEWSYYDDEGVLERSVLRDGRTIYYQHDLLGRVTSTSGAITQSFTYDHLGNVTRETRNGVTETRSYNALGWLLSEDQPAGTVSYAYDARVGWRTDLYYPDGFNVHYEYNAANQLTQISTSSGNDVVEFNYDNYGRRQNITRNGGLQTTYTYDSRSRLTRLAIPYNTLNFTYTHANQLKSKRNSDSRFNYVSSVASQTTYENNTLNQASSVAGLSLNYDGRGNMTRDSEGLTYSYNTQDLLTAQQAPSGATTLNYDASNRLSRLTKNGNQVRFVYDGADLIAEYDSAGRVLRRYVHGPSTDEPLLWYEGAGFGDRRFLHADHQGSIVAITVGSDGDTLGNINRYDAYGNKSSRDLGYASRFAYTGQVYLEEIGLYYYKARVYNQKLGRFMQADPIGYGDGMNRYAYVGSDPVNYTDPSGLSGVEYDEETVTIGDSGGGWSDGSSMYGYGQASNYGYGNVSGYAQGYAQGESWGFKNNADGDLILCIGASACSATSNIQNASTSQIFLEGLGMIPWGKATKFFPGSRAAAEALKTQLTSKMIAAGHAFEKHVLHEGQFPFIRTRAQFASHIESVMTSPTHFKQLGGGRAAYFDQRTSTIVFTNPGDADGGTAFQTTLKYFNDQN